MTARICEDCRAEIPGAKYARWCSDCRWRHRGKPRKYVWTSEKEAILRAHHDSTVRGRTKELAARLRMPRWAVQRRAAELGLTRDSDHRDWAPEEERFLTWHAGNRAPSWIARELGRSVTSITNKLKRMKLSRRRRDGYTLRELELCFGIDHKAICRWVDEGKLEVRTRGIPGPLDPWCVTDAAILRFIEAHPMAFELRRVDQFWFMDLILGGALVKRALAIESADEGPEELSEAV